MNQTEIFRPEEPLPELGMDQSPGVFESGWGTLEFEEELRRAQGFAARGGRAFGRGIGRARAPFGARRPQPPKPRPRPRWPAPGWPAAYYPLPTVPLVEPVGSAFGGGSSAEQLRCVRQCLGQDADADAVHARPESPQPEPAGSGAPAPEEFAGAADSDLNEFEILDLGPATRMPVQWEDEFRVATLPRSVRDAFDIGALAWPLAVHRAIQAGISSLDDLTDIVFFMHHPERVVAGVGQPLKTGDPQFDKLSREWKAFRTLISPMLKRPSTPGLPPAPAPIADVSRECRIIDLTVQSDRSVRKGTRDPKTVYALVLHQMACCFRRRDPLKSYLRIKAHFAILPEGQILQLHPVSALIWASHGFNARSVAVEFAGNFPSTRGRWWKGEKYGRNQVAPAQIEAGRCLVRHLIRTMGLRVVLAHRQSSNMRENDPGPDIWYHVGQWAVDTLGLSDGGPGFKIGTGNPIPDEWRTWGRRTTTMPELEFGAAEGEREEELWRGAPEGQVGLEVSLPAAIADPRSAGPGIYTLYRGGQRLYVGRSNHLRRRLQQHLWCLTHLGVGAGDYSVKLTPMRGASPTQLRRVETAVIDRYGRQAHGGTLSNVRARELEQELFEGPSGSGH